MEEADAVTDDLRHVAIDNGAVHACASHGTSCISMQHAEHRRCRQQAHIQGRTEPVQRVKPPWRMRMSRMQARSLTSQMRKRTERCARCHRHNMHAQ